MSRLPSVTPESDTVVLETVRAGSTLRRSTASNGLVNTTIDGQLFGSSRVLPQLVAASRSLHNKPGSLQETQQGPSGQYSDGNEVADSSEEGWRLPTRKKESRLRGSELPAPAARQNKEAASADPPGHPNAIPSAETKEDWYHLPPVLQNVPRIVPLLTKQQFSETASRQQRVESESAAFESKGQDEKAPGPRASATLARPQHDGTNERPKESAPVERQELDRPSKLWKKFGSLPGRIYPASEADAQDAESLEQKMQVRKFSLEKFRAANPQGLVMMRQATQLKTARRKALADVGEDESNTSGQSPYKPNRSQSKKQHHQAKRSWLHQRVLQTANNPFFVGLLGILTLYSLFGDDFRAWACPKSADNGFHWFTGFCFVMFFIEVVINSIAVPGYFLGFYFLLDLVSTASLLLDIPYLAGHILGNGANNPASIVRAGRASKAGSKAGRLIRVLRLVRLFKVQKGVHKRIEKKQSKAPPFKLADMDLSDWDTKQSRVSHILSEKITMHLIVVVLLMLFGDQVFVASQYEKDPNFEQIGLEALHGMYLDLQPQYGNFSSLTNGSAPFKLAFDLYAHPGNDLLRLVLNGTTVLNDAARINALRSSELSLNTYLTSRAIFDVQRLAKLTALLDLCKTIFVCFLLGLGSLLFSKDAHTLVLLPLERMIKRIKDISENPLMQQTQFVTASGLDDKSEEVETLALEKSIAKICSLLAIGFGDAGSEIIGENMKNGGDLNPMIPGRKVNAIFGFCDIRQFTDATEVLREQVMEFVNSIARIVHMEVSLHGGSANKNIGDAFLLVWKFPPSIEFTGGIFESEEDKLEVQKVADKALAAFLAIQAALRRSAKLAQFAFHQGLLKRFKCDRFEVKMGFGLHVGWAIEGAIGSEYKIDASYLSPNVNMASRLEAATKQFGVSLLMSEAFYSVLSPKVKRRVRQIDVVSVKGSELPVALYTMDINVDAIPRPAAFIDPNMVLGPEDSPSCQDFDDEFEEHEDIVNMRVVCNEFYFKFKEGLDMYKIGNWEVAKICFEQCENMRRDHCGHIIKDGPSRTLLNFLASHNYKSPPRWKGYRELTDK